MNTITKFIAASCAGLIVGMSMPAHAEDVQLLRYGTGSTLHEECLRGGARVKWYVSAVYDTLSILNAWERTTVRLCIPNGASAQDLTDAVCIYLRDNPGDRYYDGGSVVINTLSATWPCK